MLEASMPYRMICTELGCTKSTVSYYAAKMGLARTKRKHNWSSIRTFYEAGYSAHATRREFHVHKKTWQEAIKRGDIVQRGDRWWVRSIDQVIAARFVNRTNLKRRMIREGAVMSTCAFCGIGAWRGQPLSLELDHIKR